MRTASYVLRMTREESAMLITSWRAPPEVINWTLLALANQLLSQLAREHLHIMFLETIATSSESTSRVFGISIDQLKSKTISTLMKNQGVYNGLIAVLLLIAVWQQNLLWTQLLLVYVVLVALYGSLTSKPSIILKQGGLAILGLICSFIWVHGNKDTVITTQGGKDDA